MNMPPLKISFTLALFFVLSQTACSKKNDTHNATEPVIIKIGSVAPLTGPIAHLGKDNENGARMAIDEANTAGALIGGKKVQFKLVSEDDQQDPKIATIVAQTLVDEQVSGVIGHLNSGTSIPASKIYADAGIPEISPSATAIAYTAQGFKTTFRVMTNDSQQGKVLGKFAVKNMGGKRIAIVDDRTAYGQGLADEVAKAVVVAGGEVVAREFTTNDSTDFTAILTSIKAKQPDILFYGGMDPQAVPMVRQMHLLGLKAKFLAADGAQTADFVRNAGPDGEGVTASSPGLPLEKMPGGKEFQAKFNAKYGQIQNYAPYAYDAAKVMIAAMEQAGSADPKVYLPVLQAITFRGVTGPISFDDKGDIKGGAVTLYQVKNGQWQVLQTFNDTAVASATAVVAPSK